MKLIVAYIRPERLNPVKKELYKKGVHKISVTNALGCGEQKGFQEVYRGVETEVTLLKKVRLEIGVNDAFVRPTVEAIIKGAKTNKVGDGKIFVHPLDECYRIRTGQKGDDAIG